MSGDAKKQSAEPRQGDYLPSVRRLDLLGQTTRRGLWSRLFSKIRGANLKDSLETPDGVVIATQCCDLAREGKGEVTLVKVVHLSGADLANARRGQSPQFAPLGFIGDDAFADFGASGTARNTFVRSQSDRQSMPSQDRHIFGQRAGRRFSRFAYPDEAHNLLSWLRGKIREKARSEQSPIGSVLFRVQTIRVENPAGWENPPPWDLVVTFVLKDGELPTLDSPEGSESVFGRADDQLDYPKAAERLAKLPPGDPDVAHSWQVFCDALASGAEKSKAFDRELWLGVTIEAVDPDDFSYSRFIRSSDLDIDDLSESDGRLDQ